MIRSTQVAHAAAEHRGDGLGVAHRGAVARFRRTRFALGQRLLVPQRELRQQRALEQRVAVPEHLHLLVLSAQAASRRARGVQRARAALGGGGGGGGGGQRQRVARRRDVLGVEAPVLFKDVFGSRVVFFIWGRLPGRSSPRRLPPAFALAPAPSGRLRGRLVRRARREKLVEARTVSFFVVVVVARVFRPRVAVVSGSRRGVRVRARSVSRSPVRAPLLALSLAALSCLRLAPRALQTQSAHRLRRATTARLVFSSVVLSSLLLLPVRLASPSPSVRHDRRPIVHAGSVDVVPPPRRLGSTLAPSPQARRVPLQAPVLLAQRAAERDAVQLAQRVDFSRAGRARVDRAHAAGGARTASGATRGLVRFRRATPRPVTRRPATADARRVWNSRVTTTRSSRLPRSLRHFVRT